MPAHRKMDLHRLMQINLYPLSIGIMCTWSKISTIIPEKGHFFLKMYMHVQFWAAKSIVKFRNKQNLKWDGVMIFMTSLKNAN